MKRTIAERMREIYQRRKGYVDNGYTAPEVQPDIQSDQVKSLMEIVAALEERVEYLEASNRISRGYLP